MTPVPISVPCQPSLRLRGPVAKESANVSTVQKSIQPPRNAVIGCVLALLLGFIVGIARLSKNWLVQKVATVYIELFRNIPLLLQILFWYSAVLAPLPGPRELHEAGD